MQYAILKRMLRLPGPRWIAGRSLVAFVSIIVAGCGYSYSYKEALAANTPRAYMKYMGSMRQDQRSKHDEHYESARQHLLDLFRQANMRKLTVCYLSSADEHDKIDSLGRAWLWGGDSWSHDESRVSREGESLWENIDSLVEKELKARGYRVEFDAPIHSTRNAISRSKMHAVTSQGSLPPVESTVNLEPGAWGSRLSPPDYLATESFLKSSSWGDSDGVLLVAIPLVRNAVDYAGYNPLSMSGPTETSEISTVSVTYQLFDVASKRQVFGDCVVSLRRARASDRTITDRLGAATSWHFTENAGAFFARAVSALFEHMPAAAGQKGGIQKP